MRFVLLFLLTTLISFSSIAQGGEEGEVYLNGDTIEPKFNGGGLEKFHQYVNQNFDFSKVTKSGTIVVSFTVNTLGEIKNLRILEFPEAASATEIIRVIQKAPKWQPATRGGKPFGVDVKIPFTFTVKPALAQNKIIDNSKPLDDKLAEKKPDFNGGMNSFRKFIATNFRTPDVEGLKGKIYLSFVVEVDGSLTDIKVLKDIGYGTGAEALRVLKMSSYKWSPAKQNGKPVRSEFTLPITIGSN